MGLGSGVRLGQSQPSAGGLTLVEATALITALVVITACSRGVRRVAKQVLVGVLVRLLAGALRRALWL